MVWKTEVDNEGRVYGWDEPTEEQLAELTEVKNTRYSKLDFFDAVGDIVLLQIMEAAETDPVVRLIDRKFQAAEIIDTASKNTIDAFDYLVASELVSGFTAELKAQLCGEAG